MATKTTHVLFYLVFVLLLEAEGSNLCRICRCEIGERKISCRDVNKATLISYREHPLPWVHSLDLRRNIRLDLSHGDFRELKRLYPQVKNIDVRYTKTACPIDMEGVDVLSDCEEHVSSPPSTSDALIEEDITTTATPKEQTSLHPAVELLTQGGPVFPIHEGAVKKKDIFDTLKSFLQKEMEDNLLQFNFTSLPGKIYNKIQKLLTMKDVIWKRVVSIGSGILTCFIFVAGVVGCVMKIRKSWKRDKFQRLFSSMSGGKTPLFSTPRQIYSDSPAPPSGRLYNSAPDLSFMSDSFVTLGIKTLTPHVPKRFLHLFHGDEGELPSSKLAPRHLLGEFSGEKGSSKETDEEDTPKTAITGFLAEGGEEEEEKVVVKKGKNCKNPKKVVFEIGDSTK